MRESDDEFPFVFKCRDKPRRHDTIKQVNETMKSSEWIPLLIRKIQDQQRQIEELRQYVDIATSTKHRMSKN